jgi:hypothetical protein
LEENVPLVGGNTPMILLEIIGSTVPVACVVSGAGVAAGGRHQ